MSTTSIAPYLDLLAQRKLSPHTISAYRRDLLELAELAQGRSLGTLAALDIRKFASSLRARGLDARSIARKLSSWRGYFAWLSEQGGIAANPVDGLKPPKRSKPLPKALPADAAVQLVASDTLPGHPDAAQAQASMLCNRAMFELLYSSGLRVSELTSLDAHFVQDGRYRSQSWLDQEAGEVHVTGKGGKLRSVPVGAPALAALRAWLDARAGLPIAVNEDRHALFVSARGSRISTRLVQSRLKAHAQKLGLPVHVHPHMLRHSFASHVLQSSGDLRAVQEMLGHASISATQIYTALDFQHLAQVYDAAHPRAKKK